MLCNADYFKIIVLAIFLSGTSTPQKTESSLEEQREALFKTIKQAHNPTPKQMKKIKEIFAGSSVMGQGNPKITKHPMSKVQCQQRIKAAKATYESKEFEEICGAKYMSPLYDPATQKAKDAKSCIDKFEFPNIPCEYPVVWVRTDEAAKICSALGKRLCDAHEWEGACEGALLPPDYPFEQISKLPMNIAVKTMRSLHNQKHGAKRRWSYGSTRKKGICAMNSTKDKECNGGNWNSCGSNTYPTGAFPDCKSSLDVYDIHGNAAEHMNLPLKADQMSSTGSADLGVTEMKGSWFIFDKYKAHQDWCRWRAPFWHGTTVMNPKSHHNYHLGFRCCNSIQK